MDAKAAGDVLILVGRRNFALGGSHYLHLFGRRLGEVDRSLPWPDLTEGPAAAAAVSSLIESGLVRAAHDCSEGGLLVAAAEMALAGGLGLSLQLEELLEGDVDRAGAACFGKPPADTCWRSRRAISIASAPRSSILRSR